MSLFLIHFLEHSSFILLGHFNLKTYELLYWYIFLNILWSSLFFNYLISLFFFRIPLFGYWTWWNAPSNFPTTSFLLSVFVLLPPQIFLPLPFYCLFLSFLEISSTSSYFLVLAFSIFCSFPHCSSWLPFIPFPQNSPFPVRHVPKSPSTLGVFNFLEQSRIFWESEIHCQCSGSKAGRGAWSKLSH